MRKFGHKLSDKTFEDIKSDPIDIRTSAELAFYYLNLPIRKGGVSPIDFFGGVFRVSDFELTDHAGIRLWYCLQNEDSKYPKFFLALEKLNTYDKEFPEDVSNMVGRLNVPKPIKYKGKSPKKEDICDHLKSNLFNNVNGRFKTIRKIKVLEYSSNFRNFIRQNSTDENNPSDPYSKYVVAFFEKNEFYDRFMARNPNSVGYFIGYANIREFFPNFHRPILAGIDKDGKIILPPGTEQESKSEGTLLQHSWPPPPPNTEAET